MQKKMKKCDYCLKEYWQKHLSRHRKSCIYKSTPKIERKVDMTEMMAEMRDELMTEMRNEMKTAIKNVKTTTINNNIIITQELPVSIYDELIKKLGKEGAVNGLNEGSSVNDLLVGYKMLYPSKKKVDHPIIYEGEGFKYLKNGDVICDDKILELVVENLQRAMLYASSEMIRENIKKGMTDRLYDFYDIGNIQRNVMCKRSIKETLTNYIKILE